MPNSAVSISDEVLWFDIQKGSEKAFDIFFLRYYASLSVYASQYVSLADGQEITQDIMVWLWENRNILSFDTSIKNYLFKSVKNKCYTRINHDELKRRVHDSICKEMLGATDDPDFYIVDELTKKIEEALANLPETYREAFELNRFNGMTYKEIAHELHVSPKTIDYRIQQALKQLRKDLKEYLHLLSFLL